MKLRHALRADLPTIVEIWVDAFARDPYLRWIQPDDTRWPEFGTAWMTFISDLAIERGHTYLADTLDVATAWIPPDLSLVGPDDLARGRAILAEHAGEARADAAFETIMAARGHAPGEPHWTLQYIGVRPSRQSAGLGGAAIATMLELCDQTGLSCGLVSTNPQNVSFYERHGFRAVAEVRTADGAAVMRAMHRAPGGGG